MQYKSNGYYFSENGLHILCFDSHDVHSKFMKKFENFEKKIEVLGDAFFEHDDKFSILKR